MADNVTISLGVDNAKLRADLKIASAELRKFTRDEKAAADRAVAGTGTRADFLTTSAQAAVAAQRVNTLSAAYKELGKSQAAAIPAAKTLGTSFGNLADGLSALATTARGLRFGVIGAIIYESTRKIGEVVTDVTNAVVRLQQISKGTGFATSTIQIFQNVMKATGADVADASKILFNLSQSFNQVRLQAERAGSALGTGAQVLRGGAKDVTSEMTVLKGGMGQVENAASSMITVIKGGHGVVAPPEIKDAAAAYQALGVNVTSYTSSLQDQDRLLLDVAAGLKKWKDAGRIDVAQEIGVQVIGARYREVAAALDEIAKPGNLAALRKAMGPQGTGQIFSDEDIKRVERFNEVRNEIGDVGEGGQTQTVLQGLGAAQAASERQLALMKGLQTMPAELAQAWQDFGKKVTEGTNLAVGNVKQAYGDLGPWFDNLAKGIVANWNATMRGMSYAPFGDPSIPAMPAAPTGNASGGYIRGAGSGTSDSILARLSNGEFVVNAASVRRIGVGFLRGLNSFADGGLVGAAPIRFAAGGLVSAAAGGGRPVHLHLGGRSFALSGAGSVVDSLVAEAHAHQMRSAGVKPSWFAGRSR